ncbi:site-2 protease family protein [Paenibacillus sp. 1A_MP2]|uniref:site-2 protease family protein n=1 Tax=Paenibacillus sp. 1A_MP2 TaxID=3457495 RepID=UPI003FCD2891
MDPQILTIALIGIGLSLSVLIHELGHAITMKIFRVPIQLIEWGVGPRILKYKCFEIRLLPLAGGVYPNGALLAKKKVEGILIGIAGVLLQWIVMWIIALFRLHQVEAMETVCIAYGFASIIGLFSLIPIGRNDGKHVLQILKNSSKEKK